MGRPAFHLAIPVDDLTAARRFYGEVLGCPQGRAADTWIDWDLAGHQVVTHLAERREAVAGAVDGHGVPVPHFGLVLDITEFHRFVDRLRAADVAFETEPRVRFAGEPGEQWTMFLRDPAGNALEFKALADPDRLFAW
ncbi:VOC family protein [Actinokineospora enzanensis]|uniref:VOC family protein n=1 Tax=Actinokineospora enzanensis TaxID=155975 RepID=UPI00035E56A0|nr:VOC family protein [Actinokineospora enzanensis]